VTELQWSPTYPQHSSTLVSRHVCKLSHKFRMRRNLAGDHRNAPVPRKNKLLSHLACDRLDRTARIALRTLFFRQISHCRHGPLVTKLMPYPKIYKLSKGALFQGRQAEFQCLSRFDLICTLGITTSRRSCNTCTRHRYVVFP
jgi:hypothetical protein